MTSPEETLLASLSEYFVETERADRTISGLADHAGVDRAQAASVFSYFHETIDAWYVNRIRTAVTLKNEIAEFDALPLEERLGAFCFILLDVLEPESDFVGHTFGRHASNWGSGFRREAAAQIVGLLSGPDVPGVNQVLLESAPSVFILVEGFVQTIAWWLEDETQDRQRSTALVDRLVSLTAAIATDPVLDRGVNVVRYAVEAGYLPDVTRLFHFFTGGHDDASEPTS